MSSYGADEEISVRPKLNLQPRSLDADLAPNIPMKYANKPSPFGAARPREQVIAEREGKKETEVLKEQAQKEWKGNIILTELQREEKKAAEAELAFARRELDAEVDPVKVKILKEEVMLKERKLDGLLSSFEKLALQTAQSGGIRRSYDKKRSDERPLNGLESQDGFINFSKSRGRDSYGRANQNQCFTCGEFGHFSRECSRNSNYRGRPCFTCGQEGHYSRDCPILCGLYGSYNYTPDFPCTYEHKAEDGGAYY